MPKPKSSTSKTRTAGGKRAGKASAKTGKTAKRAKAKAAKKKAVSKKASRPKPKTKAKAKKASAARPKKAASKKTTASKNSDNKAAAKPKAKAKAKKASAARPKKAASKKTTASKNSDNKAAAKPKAKKAGRVTSTSAAPARVGSSRRPRTSPLSKALNAAQQRDITIVEDDRRLPKTKLTKKQLREFSALLLQKRRELIGNVGNLTDEALGRNRREAAGDLSAMPIHMADLGSDNWEQEFTLGLIDNERKLLREIDEALIRIEDRTYGICLATHNPISTDRLRAKPWAKYCIEYARAREAGRVP